MKKTIICNIPMKKDVESMVYVSEDKSICVSDKPYFYPINAFLEKNLSKDDEIQFLLISKKDDYSNDELNISRFLDEFNSFNNNNNIGASVETVIIDSSFSQKKEIHNSVFSRIIDCVDPNSNIYSDITYGSKDMAIVVFSALQFAERFLDCEIDNIFYGQANFVDGKPINTKICDMIPLYSLNSLTNSINCDDYTKAKQMLKTLLSI